MTYHPASRNKNRKLNTNQRKELLALIAEMRNRGLDIPKEMLQLGKLDWGKDPNDFFIKRDGKSFTPNNEDQKNFIESEARFVALISGRGGGKTASGSQKALKRLEQGLPGALLNPDFENLRTSTWPEFREWLPWDMVVLRHKYMASPEWSPNKPFTLNFNNGAWVIVKGVKDPDSARGPNLNWLWYDEAGRDLDGMGWKIANAAVRIPPDPQSWITTTPKGKLHWIYDFFVKENIPEEAVELFKKEAPHRELLDFYFTTIHANKSNLDPAFYASMLSMYTGWLKVQELDGGFVDQGGVLGDIAWFNNKFVVEPPDIFARVRYWDLAASEAKIVRGIKKNDPDETVGTRMSWDKINDSFYIEHQVGGLWEWKAIKEVILETAKIDGPYVKIFIEQEPGAGGKNQVAELEDHIRTNLPGWTIAGHRPEGDKIMRANIWFAEAQNGKIFIVRGDWNENFLDQFASFPEARHDDRVDSVSGARVTLAPIRNWKKLDFITVNYGVTNA